MINICNPPIIKIYNELGEIIINEITQQSIKLIDDCSLFSQMDFKIRKNCIIRKKQRVELWEEDKRLFVGYVYDHRTNLSEQFTSVKANGEKYIMKRRHTLQSGTYTGDYKTFVTNVVNSLNVLYNEFTVDLEGAGNIELSGLSIYDEVYNIFDNIAGQIGMDWDVVDGKVIFGKFGRDCDVLVEFDGSCNNLVEIIVSEGDRASYIIGVDTDGNTAVASDYSYGNYGMLKKNITVLPLQDSVNKCLDDLKGLQLIYEVKNITQDINCNICDSFRLLVTDCDIYNFDGMIKIQKREIDRNGCQKDVKYTVSNGVLQAYTWYGLLRR